MGQAAEVIVEQLVRETNCFSMKHVWRLAE